MIGTFDASPNPPAHLGALNVGQPQVEHDQIGGLFGRDPQRVGAGAGDVDVVAA